MYRIYRLAYHLPWRTRYLRIESVAWGFGSVIIAAGEFYLYFRIAWACVLGDVRMDVLREDAVIYPELSSSIMPLLCNQASESNPAFEK